MGDWPQWADTIGVVGICIVVVGLWLKGVLVRRADCDAIWSAKVDGLESEVALLQDHVDGLIADRDAWRSAHKMQADATHSAEMAARALIDSHNVSTQLLAALMSTVGAKERGDGSTPSTATC